MEKSANVQGVQSVEIGLSLFHVLAQRNAPCSLSELAREAGMHRAKAYRYLVSFVRMGWVARDPQTALYQVGPVVRDLASSWLHDHDALGRAEAEARALAQTVGHTCFVAIWTRAGAMAVRICQPADRMIVVGLAQGAVFDARTSATGRVFAVWRDEGLHGEIGGPEETDLAPRGAGAVDDGAARARGLAAVEGEHEAGFNGLSAPVFDQHGRLALALTLVGPASLLPVDPQGEPARALLRASRRLSASLGWQPGLSCEP